MSKFVRPAAEGADPFGTARLRRGVLDAWATSPARFREDANAEEDLVLGGYRDRLVVELAQNAADAAARAGVPGRLRLTLRDGVLAAANTGAPLDASGVESLSTLRASAKRDAHDTAVGRFGVGFAAVLAVTDEPAVVGRHGGVRWALAEARELAADTARHSPGLGDEIRRRDGHVPLLRLPFAAEGTAPDPYDTVVILPLRDTAATDLAERLLGAVDDALLLALPGLEEVVVEVGQGTPRTLRRRTDGPFTVVEDSLNGTTYWRTSSADGPLTPDLLADRPVEERLRPHWSLTWAVPVNATDGTPDRPRTAPVVHAPTPSDEPLGVPALLIASLPLDTTRRHAAPGPLTDFLVQRAADTYAELLAGWRPVSEGIIGLVPGPLGKGSWTARCGRRSWSGCRGLPFFLPPPSRTRTRTGKRSSGRGRGRIRGLSCPSPFGPVTPRSSRGPVSTPWASSPRCCRPSCPPGSNGAWNCGRWASPASRSPTPSTGWRGWRRSPAGGGGSTTASPGSTRTGSRGCPSRSLTAVRPSGPDRCCCPPRTPPGSTPRCSPGSA